MNKISEREYYLKPGYIYLTREPRIVYTVLGSCVMVCLWDKRKRYAGCCHYRYPVAKLRKDYTGEYGNIAIPGMIKYLKEFGSRITDLEAMLFGGADIMTNSGVGEKNVEIAKKILKKMKISIVSEDTGGRLGRKIIYHTYTNQAIVYKVQRIRKEDWYPYS